MRDQWYGDKRDIVKWATLLHLAQRERLSTILHVALYRPNHDWPTLRSKRGERTMPDPVVSHFRNLHDIQRLATSTGIQIKVFSVLFQDRSAYFADACQRIESLRGDPLLVFLDPDTGIAPKIVRLEHVTGEELHRRVRRDEVKGCARLLPASAAAEGLAG